MSTESTKKVPKSSNNFYCKICNYSTSRLSQLQRHELTRKHITSMFCQQIQQKSSKQGICEGYRCNCGKIYKDRSGLWRHSQKCKLSATYNDNDMKNQLNNMTGNTDVINLITENKDFKEILFEQAKQIQITQKQLWETQEQNMSIQKQLLEVVKDGKIINNHTTNNNNQKFNLNFFLNTTCKDAMNMSEFIENIESDFKDIENIGRNGYVSGMTDMIVSRIKELDITKRPLHCTDLKRETMYIKDNNEWYKDTPDNSKLHKMMAYVADRNYSIIPKWKEKHPECSHWEHPQYEFCIDMMKNVLGDIGNEQTRLDNKVIKKLSRHILVDKGV